MATISEILMAQGENAAKARQARGTMWGSLAQYAGTIPREIIAGEQQKREQAQVAQVRQLQIQKGQAEAAKADEERGKTEVLRQVYRVALGPDGKLDRERADAIVRQSIYPDLIPFLDKVQQEGLETELAANLKRAQTANLQSEADARNRPVRPPDYNLPPGATRMSGVDNTPLASVPAAEKPPTPLTYMAPTTVMVKGVRTVVRPRSDGVLISVRTGEPVTEVDPDQPPRQSSGGDGSGGATKDVVEQRRMEQQYRGVLAKATSARSGPLGIEDAKVNQAAHLMAIYDQYFDPKTGEYNIPGVQYNELAAGLARLINPTGQVGIEAQRAIKQSTAAGDLAQAVSYATGTPVTGTTQAVLKMLKDSIERQGEVAETNRDTYFSSLRAQAPTDLEPERRQALEGALKLTTLRNRTGAAKSAASDAGRIRVVGPNGETGTVPAGTPLLPGWKEAR